MGRNLDRQKLLQAVTDVLTRADPVGIVSDRVKNYDEYQAEAALIAARLRECETEACCRRIVHDVFVRQFGADTAGPEESFSELARAIWRLIDTG